MKMTMTMTRGSVYPMCLAALVSAAVLGPWRGLEGEAAGEAHYRLFVRAVDRGDWREAEARLARARRLAPDNAYYEGNWGWLQERLAGEERWSGWASISTYAARRDRVRLASARQAFTRALLLNPDDDAFLHALAWLAFLDGRSAEARAWMRRALDRERGVALYHVSRGLMAEWDDRLAEAGDAYGEALVCAPALVDSPFFAEIWTRRRETALGALARAEGRLTAPGAGPIARAKLGSLLVFKQDWVGADRTLRSALADLPALSRGWLNLARVGLASGRVEQADASLARARALDPSDPLLWGVTAEKERRAQAWEAARQSLDRAREAVRARASEHALRAGRVYKIKDPLRDDVVPQGLLLYVTPGGG